ncbi:MAG: response regulator transcription factor [Thermoleophilia bacterium]|nr:response regulator transcription factor [Thermoleophilia bacterium]
MSGERIRILIVDDHAVLRAGLRLLLDREEDLLTVGEATSAEEAMRLLEQTEADLVLLDIEMPGMGGLAGAQRIRERWPTLPILVLSMHSEADDVRRAFSAGAGGYVLKTAADEQLVQAVRAVASGERYLHPALGAALAQPMPSRGPIDDLSPREREVLRLLALGYTNQEIANELVVSVRTVESHRAHVMAKLRASSRAAMVKYALAAGLLDETR